MQRWPVEVGSEFDPSKPLSDRKRERFCEELIVGTELYEAHGIAGFKSPRGNAQRMLREPEVVARLEYLCKKIEPFEETIRAYRRLCIRRKLDNIVDADRLSFFEEYRVRGKRKLRLKSIDDLTPDQRALVEDVEITKGGIKITMPNRLGALNALRDMDGFRAPTRVAPTDASGNGPAVLEIRWKDPLDAATTDPEAAAAAGSQPNTGL
jgi:hypothetical protein